MAGGQYKDTIKKLLGLNHLEEICIVVHGEVNFPDANLERKIHLENLEFCFVGDGHQEKVSSINDLKPPPYLQLLKFEGYPGLKLPEWILEEPLINNLRRLTLRSASNVCFLPALWKLSALEFLWLYDIPNLKQLGCEFFGIEKKYERTWSYVSIYDGEEISVTIEDDDDKEEEISNHHEYDEEINVFALSFPDNEMAAAFRSLKTLRIEYLENWETWEDLDEDGEISVMPSLEELIIASCPKLLALPYHILGKIPSLKMVVNGQLTEFKSGS